MVNNRHVGNQPGNQVVNLAVYAWRHQRSHILQCQCQCNAAAVRRELRRVIPGADSEKIASDAQARRLVEDLQDPHRAEDAAEWLLGWLIEREEVADGAS